MKSAPTFALTILLTAAVAGAAGWFLARLDSDSQIVELRKEGEAARQELRRLNARLDEADARGDGPMAAKKTPEVDPAAASASAVERPVADEEEGPDRGERLARIAEIRGKVDGWFAAGKGKEALAALKELADLVPEGREAAMDLAVKINRDVNGEGKLKLSQMVFYTNLGTPGIKNLFSWSLENPSKTDFRVMAAYSLPWTQSAEDTVAQFSKALRGEKELSVQQALVWNLARMRKEEAEKALREVLTDTDRDATLRAQVATELAMSGQEDVERDLESLALSDPDERVRDAAKAAMAMRDPPATGFMITGTVPKSQAEAAGMKAGDILISYNGKETKDLRALRSAATESGEEEEVPVVVMRGGQEVTLYLRPGQMGVFGRDVKAKSER